MDGEFALTNRCAQLQALIVLDFDPPKWCVFVFLIGQDMSFSTTRFNKNGCDLLFSCGSSGNKTTKLTTKVPGWWPTKFQVFFVFFFFFRRGICLMTPFVGMNFSRFITFFGGGGRLFAGKTKANEKVSVPSAPSSGGYMLGTLARWTQMLCCWNVASLKLSGFPLKISLSQKAKWSPNPNIFQGPIDLWVLGSVSFQIAGSFGLYSRKYFDESRSPKEGWKHVRQARHKKICCGFLKLSDQDKLYQKKILMMHEKDCANTHWFEPLTNPVSEKQ